jgi:drug/metabolite transporter (DMT)-like permease
MTVKSPPINPLFALGSGVMAVSTGAIFARLADAPALTIAAYRVGLATLFLAPVAWIFARKEILSLPKKDMLTASAAGFFLALHFATWISSLNYTSVANSVVLVNTNPLWVGLLTPLVTKDKIRSATVLSIVVSVAGGITIGFGDFRSGGDALYGDGLALIGSLCAAGYLLIGRKVRQNLSLVGYIFICYGTAAVLLWILVLSLGIKSTGFTTDTWTWFFSMALFTQLVGHSSYNWALKWFPPSLIAVSLLGEPIGSTILAYIIFNEGLTWTKIIGAALIFFGIYTAAKDELR